MSDVDDSVRATRAELREAALLFALHPSSAMEEALYEAAFAYVEASRPVEQPTRVVDGEDGEGIRTHDAQ